MMYRTYSDGTIEIITGPMFAGKSEELIKRVKILGHAGISTLVVKPAIDNRWDKEKVMSRAGASIETATAKDTKEVEALWKAGNYSALAIDEVQFLDDEIVDFVIKLAGQGARVIISGLDQDYTGEGFKMMPRLLAVADLVDKQQAVCNVCYKAGTMTFRKTLDENQIAVGDSEYEPRCRKCHHAGTLERKRKLKKISDDEFATAEIHLTNN